MYMSRKRNIIQTFTIRQAAELSKLSPTMVDYLCRQEVLVPSHPKSRARGRQRQYLFGDVVMLCVIATLLDAGISVKRLKEGLRRLRRYHKEITATSLPAEYLVTDGTRVYLRKNSATLEALDDSGQYNFAFVVELTRIQADLSKHAYELRSQGDAS